MEHMRVPRKSWVVVCDGARAIILRNEGDAELLNLKTVEAFDEKHPSTAELGTDRPGRVYQSQGKARSSNEETDWHNEAEIAFLGRVADTLDRLVGEHAVKSLIVIAPPKALGVLRGHFKPHVQAVISAELAKDLTSLTVGEIEKHLAA